MSGTSHQSAAREITASESGNGSTTSPALAPTTIGRYLVDRLGALGVEHVFGIPGDYILQLYKLIDESPIKLVGVTREDNAGFAADAYARIHGLGCICVTYCVGGLSTCNSIAGAYAEKSPVIVLAGSPGMSERAHNPLLHHKVKGFETQYEVFQKITVASAVLDRPETAFSEIDRVLEAAVRYKRPVYLELPRDQVNARQVGPHRPPEGLPPSDPDALREAIDEAAALLTAARRPVILADVEIHRFGLQDELLTLAESTGMPIATTLLGKSVISEAHPLFGGVYEGGMGRPEVTELVESADCLLMLGCFMTDINLGIWTAKLDPSKCIDATSEDLRIKRHHYQDVRLDDFIRGLIDRKLKVARTPVPARDQSVFEARPAARRRATHLRPALRPAQPDARRVHRHDRDRRHRRFALWRGRPGDAPAHRVLEPRLLHVDGLRRAGRGRGQHGQPQGADPGHRRRRRVPDDRHGALDDRAARPEPDRRGPQQPRLHDRTVPARGPVQRHPGLGLSQGPRGRRGGPGARGPDRRRARLPPFVAAQANLASFSLINVHLDPYDRSPALERLAQKLSQIVTSS